MAIPTVESLQLVSEPTILGPNFGTMLNNCYYQPSQVWGIASPADIRFPGSPTPYCYEYNHGYFHPYSYQVRAYQVDYSNPGFYIVQMGDGSMVSMTAYGLENLFKSSYGNFCSASAKTVAPKSALSKNKRRATGGKKKAWRKKLKYELGRRANTKLSSNMTIRRIRVRGCKSVEVECKIEPVCNDADKVLDNCPERESDFESKMLEFLQSCRRVEEMLQHMISSAKKHDNQDEDPKLEIEGGNDVSIKEEKILDIDTVQVLDEISEEETEVWKEVHVFNENHEMEETEQLNEDEEQTLEWEGTYNLICRDYMNQSLHIDGVEDGNSVLEHLETSEAQMFGKLSTWASPQAMFNTISLSDFELSMPLTLELIVNYGGKLKVIDVLDCTGSAEFIASTLGKVEVESYTWVSSSLAVSSSWKDPIPGSCVKSSGIVVVIKCTLLAFILGVKEIICCCGKMDVTNSNYSMVRGIKKVQGELGKVIYCLGGQLPNGILYADFAKTKAPKLRYQFEKTRSIKIIQDFDQYIMWLLHIFRIVACDSLDTGQATSVRKIFAILSNTSMFSKFSTDTLRNYIDKESNKYLASVLATFVFIYSIMAAGTYAFSEDKAFGRTPITNIDPKKTWDGACTCLGVWVATFVFLSKVLCRSRSALSVVKLVQLRRLLCGVKSVSGFLRLSLKITPSGGITCLILENICVIKWLLESGSEDIFEDATHKVKVTRSGFTTVLPPYGLVQGGKVFFDSLARDSRMQMESEQLFIVMKGSVRKKFVANAIMSIQDSIFNCVDAGDCQPIVVSTFMQERLGISWNRKGATDVLTYDGLSLAWAICKFIVEVIKASTLIATHFDELTVLVNINGDNMHKQIAGVVNLLKGDNLRELTILEPLLHYFTSIAELFSCLVPTMRITKLMFNVFASAMWMMPFSKYGTIESVHLRQLFGGNEKDLLVYYFEEHKLQSNYYESNISGMEVHDDNAYMYKKKAKANLYHTYRRIRTSKGELSVISKDSKAIEVFEGINSGGVETISASAQAGVVSITTITSLLLIESCLQVVWELTMATTQSNKLLQCQMGNWLVH